MPVRGYRTIADFAKDFQNEIVENKEVIDAKVQEEEKAPPKPVVKEVDTTKKKRRGRRGGRKLNSKQNEGNKESNQLTQDKIKQRIMEAIKPIYPSISINMKQSYENGILPLPPQPHLHFNNHQTSRSIQQHANFHSLKPKESHQNTEQIAHPFHAQSQTVDVTKQFMFGASKPSFLSEKQYDTSSIRTSKQNTKSDVHFQIDQRLQSNNTLNVTPAYSFPKPSAMPSIQKTKTDSSDTNYKNLSTMQSIEKINTESNNTNYTKPSTMPSIEKTDTRSSDTIYKNIQESATITDYQDLASLPPPPPPPRPEMKKKQNFAGVNLTLFADQIKTNETREETPPAPEQPVSKKKRNFAGVNLSMFKNQIDKKQTIEYARQKEEYHGVLAQQHYFRIENKQYEPPENNPLLGQWETVTQPKQKTSTPNDLRDSQPIDAYSTHNSAFTQQNAQYYQGTQTLNQTYNNHASYFANQKSVLGEPQRIVIPLTQPKPFVRTSDAKVKRIYPKQPAQPGKKKRNPGNSCIDNWKFRERPAINEEDIRKNYFFLDPKSLNVLKKFTLGDRTNTIEDVEKLACFQSRFQYYFTLKNFSYGRKHAEEKPAFMRIGSPYPCEVCDEHFKKPHHRDEHMKTNQHEEIAILLTYFQKLTREFFKAKSIPGYELPADIQKALEEGIHVDTSKGLNKSHSENPEELHVEKLKEADATLSVEDFVVAACEKLMEKHWPKPRTEHFCRSCNFKVFETAAELHNHEISPSHKERAANFTKTWCATCQFNNSTEQKMKIHLQSETHLKIKKILDDAKLMSINYWNENHERAVQQSAIKLKEKQQQERRNKLEKDGNKHGNLPENARYAYPDSSANPDSYMYPEAYDSFQYEANPAANYRYVSAQDLQYYDGSSTSAVSGYYAGGNESQQQTVNTMEWWNAQI